MFSTILVANRGEIAVRAFRAAYELGARTVAVFPWEDRNAVHRIKAEESYLIGERGHPVRAYLDVEEIIRVARESGADAVYPGYGFLSENPDLAAACAEAGIAFIGPSADVLTMTGNKVRAIAAARAAGVPVLASSAPSREVDELLAAAEGIGFPVFAKAVAGGGGRGMRRVETRAELPDALSIAMREAEGAFGDPTMFLEQAVIRPRHIEVQVLADAGGDVVHLYERDCSVQRRHQKVVEIAPAPNLDPALRDRLCQDAIAFAREVGYVNAGTVEFLVDTAGDNAGRHVFIEMNPRIQVEHTVTEEVTDVDLVQAQMRIAAGETLADLGLVQDRIAVHGAALQCRITTEDPANGFRPDTGMVNTYRSPGGSGVRLDGGTVHAGASISPHFDSLLVKLTCRGHDFPTAVRRAQRALAEFRVRGVSTNIPFLQAVLAEPDFQAGGVATSFIDERPHLLRVSPSGDRATKLLTWLADVTVNRPYGTATVTVPPSAELPALDGATPGTAATGTPGAGWRAVLRESGPEQFAARLRAHGPVAVTDTTMRDAHQSLLATRLRTRDLVAVAPQVGLATPQLLSVECWGGATYDVALRFLGEDPWDRLAALREAMPDLCLQMLLRGRNTVGYTPYPSEVTDAFVEEAAVTGIDIFRIFDALNDVEQMRPAIAAVRDRTASVAEVALCYTGNLADPAENLYTLDYYLHLAEQIVDAGAHVLAIKDMAGLLRPAAATRLVRALRERFDLPVHLHTHDTAGGQLATLHGCGGGRGGRRRRGQRRDGRYHQSAADVGAGGRTRAHRAGDRARPARRPGPGAVLGGGAPALRAVRVRAARADRAGLRPRDPGWSAVEPAPAGDRARGGGEVRAGRGDVRRGRPDAGPPGQGDAVLEGGRRPGPAPGGGRGRPRRVRREPAELRHPGLGDRVPARRAGRPARRLAGAVPQPGAGGPRAGPAGGCADRRGPHGARRRVGGAARRLEPPAVPRAHA